MIRYRTIGSVLGLLLTATRASGGPIGSDAVLLASFTQESGLATSSPTLRVGFVLGLYEEFLQDSILLGTDNADTTWPNFQPRQFWSAGETGIIEFTPANDSEFSNFARHSTDGHNNRFVIFNSWDPLVRGGQGSTESILFDTSTDLIGYTLSLIRLSVDEITFDPNGSLGREWRWVIQYEFLGHAVIPEPTSIWLVGATTFLILLWKCKGR